MVFGHLLGYKGTWNMHQHLRGHCSQGDGWDSGGWGATSEEPGLAEQRVCADLVGGKNKTGWWYPRQRSTSFILRNLLKAKVKVAQSCLTLCDPMGYTVHGIFQARILEWVAIAFSRGSSQLRDRTWVSCIPGRCFNLWATREGPAWKELVITTLKNYYIIKKSVFSSWISGTQ